jgi:hypothetical protein
LSPKDTARWLWLIIPLAILIRLAAAWAMCDSVTDLPGIHDQFTYDALARSIVAGQGYRFPTAWYPFTPAHTPTAHWSFLYPLYLAGAYRVFGCHPLVARLIQAAIAGGISAWLIFRLGRRLFNPTVGVVAAALSAVYIYSIYYDAALMTEAFTIVGILAMLNVALDIAKASPEETAPVLHGRMIPLAPSLVGKWLLLGAIAGATVLLRQSVLPWLPVMLIWILIAGRGRVRVVHALIPLAVVALFIAPWTIRNYRTYNAFLLLNSNTGYAFYSSQHPAHGTHFISAYAAEVPADLSGLNEAQLDRALLQRGLRFILQDPKRYVLLSLSRVAVFFKFWPGPESSTMSNISRLLSYALYLPFFLYGLFLAARHRTGASLLVLFGVSYSVMHILTWASIRYRIPIDAAFMPFAALAVVDIARRLIASRSSHRAPVPGAAT